MIFNVSLSLVTGSKEKKIASLRWFSTNVPHAAFLFLSASSQSNLISSDLMIHSEVYLCLLEKDLMTFNGIHWFDHILVTPFYPAFSKVFVRDMQIIWHFSKRKICWYMLFLFMSSSNSCLVSPIIIPCFAGTRSTGTYIGCGVFHEVILHSLVLICVIARYSWRSHTECTIFKYFRIAWMGFIYISHIFVHHN